MIKVIKFDKGSWYNIPNRGMVYATKMPVTYTKSLIGETVIIENEKYEVTGVEKFAVADDTLWEGREVGLLVKKKES